MKKTRKVSVPYRGITFLNATAVREKNFTGLVSVPYRGITFLNTNWLK